MKLSWRSVRYPLFSCLKFNLYFHVSRFKSFPFCSGDRIETFPVLKIDPKDIVDTNGAGDAFVGGENIWLSISCCCCIFHSNGVLFWVVQASCLGLSRRNLWISVLGQHITLQMSSSDEQVAPFQKSLTSNEEHRKAFPSAWKPLNPHCLHTSDPSCCF